MKGTSLAKAYVACYKDKYLRDTTPLFKFPYSNVHANGALCYFSTEVIKDLVQLQTFAYRWRQVPNNDHLTGQRTELDASLRELFEMHQDADFNYDILAPMNTTFGEWGQTITRP
ncbi:hypothetical protein [Paenibacillus sp. UNC496MF]|uniref:hypothetical protein n=1 Tax=Paenibacillus sp. UNC496MF TaxID=1502753 RepID=UPI001C436707|nr:hypothetical protein [Paenibacillus sp. UNC496MF]